MLDQKIQFSSIPWRVPALISADHAEGIYRPCALSQGLA